MKRSSVLGTRFEPLLKIDDQIQADQAQFQAINVRKRRQISGTPSSGDLLALFYFFRAYGYPGGKFLELYKWQWVH